MAPSIPRSTRERRTPHQTSTSEEKNGGGRRQRTIPEKDEDGGGRRRRTSMAVSLERSMVMYSDAPYLPQEIFKNILRRLPVKSLIRFQCVCKDWKDLFKTPSFIGEQVRHSTQHDPVLLFQCDSYKCNTEHLCMINRDMQVLEYQPPNSSVGICLIIGSSDGLLCLRYKSSFTLWNPATREVLKVPDCPYRSRSGICYVGFGFSPIVNDYKIVRYSLSGLDNKRVLVQVFSVSTRSWKEVEVEKLKGIMPFILTCGFTFDGAIFWFAFKPRVEGHERCLLSFDIATGSFTLIPIPRSAHVTSESRLTTFENKLAMLSYTWVEDKSGIESTKSFSMNFSINLWVMGNGVDTLGERWIWTKIYISNPIPNLAHFLCPLTIWKNEIVGVTNGKTVLVLRNLHTNEFKRLALAMGKHSIGTVIWNYAESLVSVSRHSL